MFLKTKLPSDHLCSITCSFCFVLISTPRQSNTDKIKHYLTKSHGRIKVLKPSLTLVSGINTPLFYFMRNFISELSVIGKNKQE